MKGYFASIEQLAVANSDFRQVLYTAQHLQLVLMCLKPGEDIGAEIHTENDQFFRFEAGTGTVTVEDSVYEVSDGSVVIVPAGAKHNVANTSESDDLKLYTIYAPSHHKDGIVRATKAEAMSNEADFDGTTTE